MRGQKVIKFYRVRQWGLEREFIHPDCRADRDIILKLTGQRTINGVVRELLRDISEGLIVWQEVLAPQTDGLCSHGRALVSVYPCSDCKYEAAMKAGAL